MTLVQALYPADNCRLKLSAGRELSHDGLASQMATAVLKNMKSILSGYKCIQGTKDVRQEQSGPSHLICGIGSSGIGGSSVGGHVGSSSHGSVGGKD